MRRYILASYGTVGDVDPMLAIARALCDLGEEVIFFGNPFFEDRYKRAGIEYSLTGPSLDPDILLEDPRYTHPSHGIFNIFNLIYLPMVTVLAAAIEKEIRRKPVDMIVTHMWSFGGAMAAEKAGLPYSVVSMAPVTWYSASDPCLIGPFDPPRFLRGWLERHPIRWVINRRFSRLLADCAADLELPAEDRRFYSTQEKSVLNIGLWSLQFRGAAADDQPQSKICGFPNPWQVREAPTLSHEIKSFLEAGDPPVVLGLGSALPRFVPEVYTITQEACRELGKRAIFVGAVENIIDHPGSDLLIVPYAPYTALFPRASVVIHHGGIGSLAEALSAGLPQIVIPCGADQYDNAARAEGLGVAHRIKRQKVNKRRLLKALRTCLTNRKLQAKAVEVAELINAETDGAMVAARSIRNSFSARM